MSEMNREDWLTRLAELIAPMFGATTIPPYRVACSWPSKSATSAKSRRIGECWAPDCSDDKTTEIMITMGIDDPMNVAETLVHEMAHAVVGVQHGHKAAFKRCAQGIGLVGKMTATTAGEELTERLNALLEDLPPYPHARLNAVNKKKQGTRMLKASCGCGYTVRLTQKWADLGAPICPLCNINMIMDTYSIKQGQKKGE